MDPILESFRLNAKFLPLYALLRDKRKNTRPGLHQSSPTNRSIHPRQVNYRCIRTIGLPSIEDLDCICPRSKQAKASTLSGVYICSKRIIAGSAQKSLRMWQRTTKNAIGMSPFYILFTRWLIVLFELKTKNMPPALRWIENKVTGLQGTLCGSAHYPEHPASRRFL